jgi:hypothetical protein
MHATSRMTWYKTQRTPGLRRMAPGLGGESNVPVESGSASELETDFDMGSGSEGDDDNSSEDDESDSYATP